MEWVLIAAISWAALAQSTTNVIEGFKTEELCKQAAEAIKADLAKNGPAPEPRTFGHVLCVRRQ